MCPGCGSRQAGKVKVRVRSRKKHRRSAKEGAKRDTARIAMTVVLVVACSALVLLVLWLIACLLFDPGTGTGADEDVAQRAVTWGPLLASALARILAY